MIWGLNSILFKPKSKGEFSKEKFNRKAFVDGQKAPKEAVEQAEKRTEKEAVEQAEKRNEKKDKVDEE